MVKSILKGKIWTGVAKFRLSIRQAELGRLFRVANISICPINIGRALLKIQPIRRSSRISVKRQILQDQSGFSLIEALVSILLLSIIVIGILTVATSAYKLVRFVDARETAKNYAEWEMEYIQQQPYASSYSPKQNPAYPGYTVSNPVVTSISTGEQIDVTITGNGVTYKLSDYKVNY